MASDSAYILREAELNGGKLAGVGARIVAETLSRRCARLTGVDPDPTS